MVSPLLVTCSLAASPWTGLLITVMFGLLQRSPSWPGSKAAPCCSPVVVTEPVHVQPAPNVTERGATGVD